ncbi:MAG: zinc-dependent metalloprotease [Gemmatimonadota bacterium]
MTRRPLAIALALCAGALNAGAAHNPRTPPTPQNPPAGQAPQGQGPGQGARPPQQEGPKPYREVITAQAVTDSGVFIIHRIGEKLFYEIPRNMFGREFLLIADYRGTTRGVNLAGEELNNRIVRWELLGNRALFRIVSYENRADTTRAVSRAVSLSNLAPIVMSFDIAAFSPGDSNVVIEVTRLFTTDVGELNLRQDRVRIRRLDPSRSLVERARSFSRNVEVSALQTFEVDSVPRVGFGADSGDATLNSLTVLMNYSMVLLPDRPMMARLCDDRVGYFNLTFRDYGSGDAAVPERCFISRFRLEPSNPGARVSDPVEPITWYIDPATPEALVPWMIRGVQAWEPVFRAAGFSNAIRARVAPTAAEDSTFDLDDARFSTIRWTASRTANAQGPHVSDPRSGEILNANVIFYHNITQLVRNWYWTQAGATDPRASALPLPDSLMGELVAWVVTHEVGHSLGLRHNMIASGFYPVDSLRSRSFTCRMRNTSPSIMDYARYNYVAQPGDGACLMQGIGDYDYYAINWGYGRIPGAASPEAERPVLDSLARLQDANPYYRWLGDRDPTDPRAEPEQLGDDAVRATGLGVQNIRRLATMLIPATTRDPRENYDLLNDLYGALIGQWRREMGHVAVIVGGLYHDERYAGQAGVRYTPVPRAKQADAVRFLLAEAFTTPGYLLDTAVLRRIEYTGSVERLRRGQDTLLTILLQDSRLARMAENVSFGAMYGIPDLLGDLRRGLFTEAAAARPVADAYRRNLQRGFVDQLDRLINTPLTAQVRTPPRFLRQAPPPPRPADARALARAELRDLDTSLRAVILRTTDRTTKAHFEDLRARIDRILNPR